ncbi:MAG TPA: thiamine phosphate synthase [Pyrinomonadaceae bacterium]|nr:thiamine phosphate synthase [Pyrinomonadaceae bacterium]
MALLLPKPILYLITRGATAEATTSASKEFQDILGQVSAAVAAGIQLIQLREKRLIARVLFELTARAAEFTRGTSTRLLVNDRADIAAGAGADGVHLTTRSLEPKIVRKTFGDDFLIGASTHSLAEATAARNGDADFVVLGPIFPTPSKAEYGPPLGVHGLADVASELAPFPVLALGGISTENAQECLRAGASGIAGISLFRATENLGRTFEEIGKLAQIH